MKYAGLFALLALPLLALASTHRGLWLLLIWPAISFAIVAAAYLRFGHQVFGKRADGSIAPLTFTVLAPYLTYVWLVWHVLRFVSREPATHWLTERIVIGRRLLPGEFPAGINTIVDLTCEFPEPRKLRQQAHYHSFPILDAAARPAEELVMLANELSSIEGTIYIHCAQGHGRTGLLAALLLIATGECDDAESALQRVVTARPHVGLSRVQMSVLSAAAEKCLHAGTERLSTERR